MIRIETGTIGEAHDQIMRTLLKEWVVEATPPLITEDGEETIECPGIVVRVNRPWGNPKTSYALEFGKNSLNKYVDELIDIIPDSGGFDYTYGNRLFSYPTLNTIRDSMGEIKSAEWSGDGSGIGIDQITKGVISRLTTNPTSRRAIGVTWVVDKDIESKNPPCLQLVQFLIRENKLNLHAIFRSHDMASGWGPNVYALEALQRFVLNRINFITDVALLQGYIETYSVSAHIYLKQDQVRKFRRVLNI